MNLRLVVAAAVAVTAMAGFSVSAGAAPKHDECPVGPGENGGSTIGAWEKMTQAALEGALAAAGYSGAEAIAAEIFAKENKNDDDYLCVMPQVLPNDASGETEFFVSRDNNANA